MFVSCAAADSMRRASLWGEYFITGERAFLGSKGIRKGAIPVTLALQQLYINLPRPSIYAPSYDLTPNAGVDLPSCEVDFVMILPRRDLDKAEIILGECKDEGGFVDSKDVE